MEIGDELTFEFAGEVKKGILEKICIIGSKDLYYIRSGKRLYPVRKQKILYEH